MKVRLAIVAAGIGLVSLVPLVDAHATTSPTPQPTVNSSGGRAACVAVSQANFGVCISNPFDDL